MNEADLLLGGPEDGFGRSVGKVVEAVLERVEQDGYCRPWAAGTRGGRLLFTCTLAEGRLGMGTARNGRALARVLRAARADGVAVGAVRVVGTGEPPRPDEPPELVELRATRALMVSVARLRGGVLVDGTLAYAYSVDDFGRVVPSGALGEAGALLAPWSRRPLGAVVRRAREALRDAGAMGWPWGARALLGLSPAAVFDDDLAQALEGRGRLL